MFLLRRVKVISFEPDDMVKVQKWDFGDIHNLSIDSLHELNEDYRKFHQLSFCARLHIIINVMVISSFYVNVISIANVASSFKSILDEKPCRNFWTKNDCARFQELTGEIYIEIWGETT